MKTTVCYVINRIRYTLKLSIRNTFLSLLSITFKSTQEGAIKKLPIMLCGNKTDQRPQAEAEGRKTVCYDEGQRLARVC